MATTFLPMDVAPRATRLRARLAADGVDAFLVTSLTNIRYLTGFTGSAGLVVVTPDALVLVTDGRYGEQAADQVASSGAAATVEITSTAQREVVLAAIDSASRVGLEAEHVTWAAQRRYSDEWFSGRELVATAGLVEALRRVKDAGELDRMQRAASIADDALASVRHRLVEGPTELEFARELDAAMLERGAQRTSFETIVASGPNGARPHARPTDRVIADGELVVLDFGCVVDGYCSDMTRTVTIGDVSATAQRMFEVVLAANEAGEAAIAAGASASEVDAACRAVIAEAGWADAFSHGTGHGVGIDIHEAPRVAATSTDVLEVGNVITCEPGVYLPAHGGVRIEDTLVVTPEGGRPLNRTTKSPTP